MLALLSWVTTPLIPIGFDPGAIITALIALCGLPKEAKKMRQVALAGLLIGLLKLLVIVVILLRVIIGFAANPVAH